MEMDVPNSEQLADIRHADAQLGTEPGALQLFPVVYTHRRQLLALVKAHEDADAQADALVKELARHVWGEDDHAPTPAGWTLGELVVEIRERVQMQRGHAVVATPPPSPVHICGNYHCVGDCGES